jgi:hypothetical protein
MSDLSDAPQSRRGGYIATRLADGKRVRFEPMK